MFPILLIILILLYLFMLMLLTRLSTRGSLSNADFFVASRKSKWYVVAFGMIGSSISGISIVAVPAMVHSSGFTYLQMCIGFILGYIIVALFLLPKYFNTGLSIYEYLEKRFGTVTHLTVSWFFIISKVILSGVKLCVAIIVLHQFIFFSLGVPMWAVVLISVFIIWLYTFKGGIKTIVLTDALQSFIFLTLLVALLISVMNIMGLSLSQAVSTIYNSDFSRLFVFDNFWDSQNFFKQFVSGVLVVIAMTGLSQDMMQTTLSCKNVKEAKKNMLWYGVFFVPVNLLLLSLGALMFTHISQDSAFVLNKYNNVVPEFISAYLGGVISVFFVVGIIAATFNSVDSSLTSIATIFLVDIMKKSDDTAYSIKLRKKIYLAVCVLIMLVVLVFVYIPDKNLLDMIYSIVGYLYGPLMAIFYLGLFTDRKINDMVVPYVFILSPIITYIVVFWIQNRSNYKFGYETLLINSIITFVILGVSTYFIDRINIYKDRFFFRK